MQQYVHAKAVGLLIAMTALLCPCLEHCICLMGTVNQLDHELIALGAGKTYVGVKVVQALVANASSQLSRFSPSGGLYAGPIMLVTMTNHALDQFLEGLLKAGISKLIRVGGRSKSQMLEPYNLNTIWKDYKDKNERRQAYDYHQCALLQHDCKFSICMRPYLTQCSP